MTSLKRALWLLGAAGLFVGLIVMVIILSSDHMTQRGLFVAVVELIGLSFIGTGLFAWSRRPANRTGAIMVATGFSWFVFGLGASDTPSVFTAGLILNNLPLIATVYLLLSFPVGELQGRIDRWIMAAAWTSGLILQLPAMLFFDSTSTSECDGCPANSLLVDANDDVYGAISSFQTAIAAALFVALVVVLVNRWRRYGQAQRQAFAPVLLSGAGAAGLLMVAFAADLAGAPEDLSAILFVTSICMFALVPFAFLFGLLRGRFSRAGAVGELVERLGTSPTDARDLRRALADALADPDLTIAYWYPEGDRFVDGDGHPVELPGEGTARAVSNVEHDGRRIAAIVHDAGLLEEPDLIRAVGAAAALALENERLEAELRARIEELRASRARIVEAGDAARRRIERDLHDGAQQRLVALSLDLKLARSTIDSDPAEAAKMLERASADLDTATGELRELARGIHPAVLSDQGLEEALRSLAGRAPMPVELGSLPDPRLPAPVEAAAYFVVAEALTNVARYAQASHAAVSVDRSNGAVTVEVRDDGVGGADPASGSGLRGLEDRVAALDGTMSVMSPAGQGTVVAARIPCE